MRDYLSTKQGFVVITSGSFGEGLEMKGSDVDMMFEQYDDIQTDTMTKTYLVV
jgi:hypothetical protein